MEVQTFCNHGAKFWPEPESPKFDWPRLALWAIIWSLIFFGAYKIAKADEEKLKYEPVTKTELTSRVSDTILCDTAEQILQIFQAGNDAEDFKANIRTFQIFLMTPNSRNAPTCDYVKDTLFGFSGRFLKVLQVLGNDGRKRNAFIAEVSYSMSVTGYIVLSEESFHRVYDKDQGKRA